MAAFRGLRYFNNNEYILANAYVVYNNIAPCGLLR